MTRIDYDGGYLTVERSGLGNVIVTDHYRDGEDTAVRGHDEMTLAPAVLGRLAAALVGEAQSDARRAAAEPESPSMHDGLTAEVQA